jgi:hypothetical protein
MLEILQSSHRAAKTRSSNGADVFTSFATLMKIPLVTTDGEEHQVCRLLFDDRSWTICFLIADAGSWLSSRQVVIRACAIDGPDWTKQVIAANLTHQELIGCADVSSVKPVSQQQQLALKSISDQEQRFVPTLTVQSISWGIHRVTLNSRSFIRSQTLPLGQDSFIETSGRCSIYGKGMPTK